MMTLKEWNQKANPCPQLRYPRRNGIACNECGDELEDTESAILTSNPPQKNVRCPSCGWSGYRLA